MSKKLDFICIGAPKAATSTLFELIKGHPDIYIPPAKEVPYFNDDDIYNKGWQWYMKTFFSGAKNGQKIGTLTPQYTSGFGKNTPELIAERIYKQSPDTKIILMARHPIERSYSHFKMHARHGYLKGSFEQNVLLLLKKDLEKERANLSQGNSYLFASEYGRVLEKYSKLFGKNGVMVILTDQIDRNPAAVIEKVFDFLDVDNTYKPGDLGIRTNRGGSKAKIKYLNSAYLHKFPVVKFLWQRLVPAPVRKRIYLKVLFWNTKVDSTSLDPRSKTYKQLVDFFKNDVKKFKKLSEISVPWADWIKDS